MNKEIITILRSFFAYLDLWKWNGENLYAKISIIKVYLVSVVFKIHLLKQGRDVRLILQ